MTLKVSNDVANVLSNSVIDGGLLYLPPGQLERKLYIAVNKVLDAIDGKWNRAKKAHVFAENPSDKIDRILLTGEYTNVKTEFQFFETPDDLAAQIVERANIQSGETVCEPSAGRARIAQLVKGCDCVELNDQNHEYLSAAGFNVVGRNFMETTKRYDVFIANPPFTRQQDVDHINHMLDLANRCVVSVASASVIFRTNRKTVEFRDRIHSLGGTIKALPEKTFSSSGTNVNTCLVVVDRI